MKSYSFRSAGPRVLTQLVMFLLIGVLAASRIDRSTALGRLQIAAAGLLACAALIAAFWYVLVTEKVTAADDELVFQTYFLEFPLGPARRARKLDVIGAGLNRIGFRRPFAGGRYNALTTEIPGWTLVVRCRTGPTLTNRLPLNDEDAEALLAFVRAELPSGASLG